MRAPSALASVVILAALASVALAGGPSTDGDNALGRSSDVVLLTRGPITRLAADGRRIAAASAGDAAGGCSQIRVWGDPRARARGFRATRYGCDSIVCNAGTQCIDAIALGAGHVAWIERAGGNSLELRLQVALASGGRVKEVEFVANNGGAAENPEGSWIGNLFAGGPVLAYNRWRFVCDAPDDTDCGYDDPQLRRADERLVRVASGRRIVLARGADAFPLQAAGGGRLAIASDGGFVILDASGSRVASVAALSNATPRAIALSRTRLAVQRAHTLDLYDPATGAAVKSIPLGRDESLELAGVNARFVLLRARQRLLAIRLGDGRRVSLPLRTGARVLVDAKVTEAGLFYAYNLPGSARKGRIVFEPTSAVLRRF